ncbi:MAG: Ig-like domain-containing protein, partial [Aeromicrobium sp.]
ANTITVRAENQFKNFYWLDQKTGAIHPATVRDGAVTFSLDAGGDALGRGATPSKPSNGIALLAEPAGVTIAPSDLTAGLPDGVDRVAPDTTTPVTPTSLTVTADNLDGVIGGAATTQTFTDTVLGNWKDSSFQGGTLQSVVSDGIYQATIDVVPAAGKKYELNLGQVFTAAKVTVNGKVSGQAIFAPYEIDITDQLKPGANQVEIAVTPRKKNRYYPAATNTNGQYSMAAPQDAGLVGPITLQTSADPTYVPPAPPVVPPVTPPGKVTPTVSFKLSSSSIKAGRNARATVVVKAAGIAGPTGTIRIKDGSKTLKTVTLRAKDRGRRTFTVPKLGKGRHKLKVVYSGSASVSGRTSVTRTLRVR